MSPSLGSSAHVHITIRNDAVFYFFIYIYIFNNYELPCTETFWYLSMAINHSSSVTMQNTVNVSVIWDNEE